MKVIPIDLKTLFHIHIIYCFIQIFTILFSHCPQIAKVSLGGQCLYKTKYALLGYKFDF